MMEQVDHNRKGSRETDDIRENAEDISDLALFSEMSQKTRKPNESAHPYEKCMDSNDWRSNLLVKSMRFWSQACF